MYFNLVMDHFIFNKDSQKQRIFNLLIKSSNKTAKQIYFSLKKNDINNFTYQSIFKSLGELCKDGILIKRHLNYEINFDWIDNQIDYLKNLKKVGEYKNILFNSKNVEMFLFNNLEDVDKFIQSKVLLFTEELNIKETYWKTPHCWWLIGYPMTEEKVVKKYNDKQLKCTTIICGDSELDKKAIKYYKEKKDFIAILNTNCDNRNEVLQIIGDYIIIFELPKEILKKMDEFYEEGETKDYFKKMLNLISSDINIELKIIKDKYLTEYYIKKFKRL